MISTPITTSYRWLCYLAGNLKAEAACFSADSLISQVVAGVEGPVHIVFCEVMSRDPRSQTLW